MTNSEDKIFYGIEDIERKIKSPTEDNLCLKIFSKLNTVCLFFS